MTEHIDFMAFDVTTRRLQPSRRVAGSIYLVELQMAGDPNLAWVLGWWNADTHYVDRDGVVRALPPGGILPDADLPPY